MSATDDLAENDPFVKNRKAATWADGRPKPTEYKMVKCPDCGIDNLLVVYIDASPDEDYNSHRCSICQGKYNEKMGGK